MVARKRLEMACRRLEEAEKCAIEGARHIPVRKLVQSPDWDGGSSAQGRALDSTLRRRNTNIDT